jgi:hypothetical protein
MELRKLEEHWNNFPEMSLEERPVLSSDLEKMALHNPLAPDFYLKNKILFRIYGSILFGLLAIYILKTSWKGGESSDLYQQCLGLLLLGYFIYFNIRLLYYSDYSSLGTLPLVAFLGKIEGILDRYMHTYRIISLLAAVYLPVVTEKIFSPINRDGYSGFGQSHFYKWLTMVFLSVSFYILFLHTRIPKYKKLWLAVRSYRQGIILARRHHPV